MPGIPRHGDKTAEKIMRDPDLFAQKMEDPEWKAHFELNLSLIRIDPLSNEEIAGIHVVESDLQPSLIQEQFQAWDFSFASKEKPWDTFVQTFSAV